MNVQAERDAPEKIICPSLAALEKMPSQHVLSEKLYTNRRKELLRAPGQSDEVRAFRLSNCQFNAGSWLNSIPMLSRFKCSSAVFKVMLQFRLCLPLAYSDGVKECARGQKAGYTFKFGWHLQQSSSHSQSQPCARHYLRDVQVAQSGCQDGS